MALPLSLGSITEQIKTTPVKSGFGVTAPEGRSEVNPQESLENTFAFFHITGTVGAMALSLIAKRKKIDSGISFQDKTVNTQQPMLADNPSHR